ncbi:tetratricopeptide repeat protein [Ferrovibrio sp.]|uniref:tetratricopeptide repeat protein n=1 Tax=Ferrovibrio sp. TaxID=1917215 RepID=UPI001B6C53AE|nr:tetratricopeptide repeat protein [Ferrovibrio sp.]MBP7063015.1 tetratricopeptide repeat protein [Ferrovibrio sp.]
MRLHSTFGLHKPALLLLLILAGCNSGNQDTRPVTTAPAASTAQEAVTRPLPVPQYSAALDGQLKAYDEATRLSTNPQVKIENQYNKANALQRAGRPAEAIAVYEGIVKSWGDTTEPNLKRFVISAKMSIAQQYRVLNRPDDAYAAFEAAVVSAGSGKDDLYKNHIATSRLFQGEVLIDQRKFTEAAILLRQSIADHCTSTDQRRINTCARSRRHLAWALQQRGLLDDALAMLNEVIAQHGRGTTAELRLETTIAHARKGLLFTEQLKRPNDAIEAYGEAVKTGMLANTAEARAWSALALVNRGVALSNQGRRQEAIDSYDLAMLYFDSYNEAGLVNPLGRALLNKAALLQALGRPAEALPVYQAVLRKAGQARPGPQLDLVGQAQIGSGRVLLRLQRFDEAIATFDSAINQLGNSPRTELREIAAQAASAKASAYRLQQGRMDVMKALGNVEAELQAERAKPEPDRSRGVASKQLLRATTYMVLGMLDEAITAFDGVDADFGTSQDSMVRGFAARALQGKALAQQSQGKNTEAGATMRHLIERHKDMREGTTPQVVREAEQWLRAHPQHEPVG